MSDVSEKSTLLGLILFLFGLAVLGSFFLLFATMSLGTAGDIIMLLLVGISSFNLYAFARLFAIYYHLG